MPPADRAACREAHPRTARAPSTPPRCCCRRGCAIPPTALYAFCRLADDAVDRRWRRARILCPYFRRGSIASTTAVRTLSRPSARSRISSAVTRFPQALPEALLEGLAWDVERPPLRDFGRPPRLRRPRRRHGRGHDVPADGRAGAGNRSPAPAISGVAMQLTNIARDVGEDARAGRIYLPLAMACGGGHRPGRLARPPRDHPGAAPRDRPPPRRRRRTLPPLGGRHP